MHKEKEHSTTREFNFLNSELGTKLVGQETMEKLKKGTAKLDSEPLYVRKKIGLAGEYDLLSSSLNESVGVTNIDKKRLPKFINFMIRRISFGYTSAALGAKVAEALAYSSFDTSVPPVLQNADLIIKQNDQPLCTFPIKTFLREDKVRHALGEAGFELPYIVGIKEDVLFQISIKFPEGQALDGTMDHFVEIFLRGTRTKSK